MDAIYGRLATTLVLLLLLLRLLVLPAYYRPLALVGCLWHGGTQFFGAPQNNRRVSACDYGEVKEQDM